MGEDALRPGTAAYLAGSDVESIALWSRAFNEGAERGDVEQAARAAFYLSLTLMLRGEGAQANGWLTRGRRLVEERDCPELGLLTAMESVLTMPVDMARARQLMEAALEMSDRVSDRDLRAFTRLGYGQALAHLGEIARGVGFLDEAMLLVLEGDMSPVIQGLIYCACIVTCARMFDVRRAQEWTTALTEWCETRPDMVPYRGQCLVHRSELLQMRGAWADAMEEARRACAHMGEPVQGPVGAAFYQCGELHRLLGRFEEAEEAYKRASEHGHEPQPGLSLLRLAEGKLEQAVAAIRRIMAEARGYGLAPGGWEFGRPILLEPYVEIMIAGGDAPTARAAAAELEETADRFGSPVLRARAHRAWGAVHLADGDAPSALERLRAAWTGFRDLAAPYEVARTRVLLAEACRALDDLDTASMHLEAARATFETLDAAPDLKRLDQLEQPAAGPLSARELEVLALIANGDTNREIANALVISERTVARHLSNIFTKLGVSSRTAASAYAYKHGLVRA